MANKPRHFRDWRKINGFPTNMPIRGPFFQGANAYAQAGFSPVGVYGSTAFAVGRDTASGFAAAIYSSDSGMTWTKTLSALIPGIGGTWSKPLFANGIWASINAGEGIYRSADGKTLTFSVIGMTHQMLLFRGGIWSGSNRWSNDNGATWQFYLVGGLPSGVILGNGVWSARRGLYVINGQSDVGVATMWTSVDGKNLVALAANMAARDPLPMVEHPDTGLIVFVRGVVYWTATDLTVWTQRAWTRPNTNIRDVIWTGSQFVAVGSDTGTGAAVMLISDDGLTWTDVSSFAAGMRTMWGIDRPPTGGPCVVTKDADLAVYSTVTSHYLV